jgi:hypothetical protein
MSTIQGLLAHTHRRTQEAINRLAVRLVVRGERGDVPGWVMITLMTAGLVAIIWAVAEDQFKALFNDAINDVRR